MRAAPKEGQSPASTETPAWGSPLVPPPPGSGRGCPVCPAASSVLSRPLSSSRRCLPRPAAVPLCWSLAGGRPLPAMPCPSPSLLPEASTSASRASRVPSMVQSPQGYSALASGLPGTTRYTAQPPNLSAQQIRGIGFPRAGGQRGRPDPPPGPSPSTWTSHFSVGISPPPPPSSFLPCCRSGAPPCPRDLPLRVRGPHSLCSCHWGASPPACPPPGRRGRGWGLSSPPPPPPAVPPSLSGPVALGSRSPRVRSPTARDLQVEAGGAWFVGAGRTAAWTTRHRPLRG